MVNFGLEGKSSVKMANFCISPTPLLLGGPKTGFMHFSGSPRRSNASPRCTCKSGFGSSFSIILTIIHWTNEDLNK